VTQRSRTIVLAAATLTLLLLAGTAAALYQSTVGLRVDRAPGEVVLVTQPELEETAKGLVNKFLEGNPALVVSARVADPQAAVAEVAGGEADLALLRKDAEYPGTSAGVYGPDRFFGPSRLFELSSQIAFYQHVVLAVPFLHPLQSLTSRQAVALLDGENLAWADLGVDQPGTVAVRPLAALTAPGTPTWVSPTEDLILAGSLHQVKMPLRPLEIDGIMPTRISIATGRYPLSLPVVLVRRDRQPNLLARVLEPYLVPNRDAVEDFGEWLGSQPARDVVYGKKQPSLTLAAVGDVMLARGVASKIARYGLDYAFGNTGERLKRADIAFANLESPFGTTGHPIPNKGIWFRAAPESAKTLVEAGIDVVNLANNHILDYDTPNFLETLKILEENQVRYTGGGRNYAEAHRPAVIEKNGITVAFLGYSAFGDIFWTYSYPRSFSATDNRPGVATLGENHLEEIRRDIENARRLADVVVVAFHWGDEYVEVPNEGQKRFGRWAIDAGADIVLGSHPHAVQGLELYKGKLIAYSLGNFIMDQKREITRRSMILELILTRKGVQQVRVVPVRIQEHQPQIQEGNPAYTLLERIRAISEKIGP